MRRAAVCLSTALVLLAGTVLAAPVEATDFRNPPNAVTWKIDHTNKTINVFVQLQIYPACDHCPGVVNQFLVDKIKSIIETYWNRGLHYKCYLLQFNVDITLGTDRFHIDDDRIGVRIDNGPVEVRDHVQGQQAAGAQWNSNDAKDRFVPTNDSLAPTSWGEYAARDFSNTYAHEFAHILGLDDHYRDVVDANGNLTSEPLPGAPKDLMSTGEFALSQDTIDRVVERNGIHEKDLKCVCPNPERQSSRADRSEMAGRRRRTNRRCHGADPAVRDLRLRRHGHDEVHQQYVLPRLRAEARDQLDRYSHVAA